MYSTHMRALYHFCCCQSHSSGWVRCSTNWRSRWEKKGHGQASEDPECCHECCDQQQHHVQHGWDAEKAWMAEHWKSSETSNLLLDGKGSPRESCPFYEDMIACNVSNYYTSRQGHLLWLITSLPIYLLMLCMRLTRLHMAMRPEFL